MEYILPIKFDLDQEYNFDNNQNEYCNVLKSLEYTKNKINVIGEEKWNKLRKIMNPYNFPVNRNFNRAFYKIWEIIEEFNLRKRNMSCLSMCEAPGSFIYGIYTNYMNFSKIIDSEGFIEKYNQRKEINKCIFDTFSINKKGFPEYNNLIYKNKYINILSYKESDITDKETLDYFSRNLHKYDIITCDGGIDDAGNYDKKEELHKNLINSQIILGVKLQKMSGNLICKFYDITQDYTIENIIFLYKNYRKVFIYKPITSRITNSEKYIICIDYLHVPKIIEEEKIDKLKDLLININIYFSKFQIKNINKCLEYVNFLDDYNFIEKSKESKKRNFERWKKTYSFF